MWRNSLFRARKCFNVKYSHTSVRRVMNGLIEPIDIKQQCRDIIMKCHPEDVSLLTKTICTILQNHRNRRVILSSVSFRATNELKVLLKWLFDQIESGKITSPPSIDNPDLDRKVRGRFMKVYLEFYKVHGAQPEDMLDDGLESIRLPKELRNSIQDAISQIPTQLLVDLTVFVKNFNFAAQRVSQDADNTVEMEKLESLVTDIIDTSAYHLPSVKPILDTMPLSSTGSQYLYVRFRSQKRQQIEATVNKFEGLIHKFHGKVPQWLEDERTSSTDSSQARTKLYGSNYKHYVRVDAHPRMIYSALERCRMEELDNEVEPRIQPPEVVTSESSSDTLVAQPSYLKNVGDIPNEVLEASTETELSAYTYSEFNENAEDPKSVTRSGKGIRLERTLHSMYHPDAPSVEAINDNWESYVEDDMLSATSSENKLLVDNLPPRIKSAELKFAFRRMGRVKFIKIFHTNKFEANVPILPSNIQKVNRGAKTMSQVKKIMRSDSYAFIVLDSAEANEIATREDIQIFGLCLEGYRCGVFQARTRKTLVIELTKPASTQRWIETLSNCLGSDFDITYDSSHNNVRPSFIQMDFLTHEDAWKAFLLLELASQESDLNFSVGWTKTTWFYHLAVKARERRRNSKAYLARMADENVKQNKMSSNSETGS